MMTIWKSLVTRWFVLITHLIPNVDSLLQIQFTNTVIHIGYLNECLTLEIKISDRICNIVVLYRPPRQSQDEFERFSDNL